MTYSKFTAGTWHLLICILVVISCKKDPISTEPMSSIPVANAGEDQTIFLPDQRFLELNGSRSYDPDAGGRPLSYVWTKLNGPEVLYFSPSFTKVSMVIVEPAVYSFELKIVDAQSNEDRDTVIVTAQWGTICTPNATMVKSNFRVDAILNELVPSDMSIGKNQKIMVFAGGRTEQDDGWGGSDKYSAAFYVYDMISKAQDKNQLSLARGEIGVAVSDREVFFAGGIMTSVVTDVVDIYDLTSKSMSKAKLSAARSSINCVVAGNKVFFAGGRYAGNSSSDVVDIYDMNTKTWTVAKLSMPRSDISVVSSGSKVYFAGGDFNFGTPSGRIDVYDLNSGQWTTLELAVPRSGISSSSLGTDIIFAGGVNTREAKKINQADFLNTSSMTIKWECLIAREQYWIGDDPGLFSAVVNDKYFFYLNNYVITRYNAEDQKWSLSAIPIDTNIFGLVSDGADLLALSYETDQNSLGYTGKLTIHRVSF
jgi:Kelch motif